MKKCIKCGKVIVPGVNGCSFLDECFDCHGGYPKYTAPFTGVSITFSPEDLDSLEDGCLDMGDNDIE